MEREYKSDIHDINNISLPLMIAVNIIFLTFWGDDKHWYLYAVLVVLIIISSLTFFSAKKIKFWLRSRIVILFREDGLHITEYHRTKDIVLKTYEIQWNQIKSYRYYRTDDKINHIMLTMTNNKIRDFGFDDHNDLTKTLSLDGIVGIFHSFIRYYNVNNARKIVLKKGRFDVRLRDYFITYGVVAIAIPFFCLFFHRPQFIYAYPIMIFQLNAMMWRIQNRDIYNRICQLDKTETV